MQTLLKYFFAGILICSGVISRSQVTCPSNIDFELGNFNNWTCLSGWVGNPSGFNQVTWTGFLPEPFRHLIISGPDTTTDEYGKFPRLCPNGSGFSVKLGNHNVGGEAEGLSYMFDVPSGVTNYSIFFHYAIVLEDPNHNSEQQPRFKARLLDDATGLPIECVNFDFTASASLPGFLPSPVKPNVLYKNWTPITLNLTPFAGRRLILEFITSDCTLQGHFGYAYVDVSSSCNGAISGTIVCEGDPQGNLVAPFGFAAYTWYDPGFTTILSTGQVLTLSPPPALGSTFPVILEPYPGFGCRDTLYATITSSPKPIAYAGDDRIVCTYESTQLGRPPDPRLRYSWTPAAELINPNTSNPFTKLNLAGPTSFWLSVLDPTTGCIGEDAVVVTPIIIDTSLQVTGSLLFCGDDPRNTSLRVLVPGESIQWFANNQPITGANAVQYDPLPSVTTGYYAEITKAGCRDTTRVTTVVIPPDPIASFRPAMKLQCMNVPVTFLNTSLISGNDSLSFTWRLQNGMEFTDRDLVTIFNSPGMQQITLKAVSSYGCEDSVVQVFDIAEYCNVDVPTAFTPNGDGLNDIFKPTLNGIKSLKRFIIYDRWGTVVYQTSTIDEGWNGTRNGLKVDTGVYVWLVEYESYDNKIHVRKGTITLIR